VLTPTWQGQGSAADEDYGWAVGSAGDTNADGYGDIVIGAPGYHHAGRALIYTGTLAGPAPIAAWQVLGDQTGSRYGASVAGAGDVNGDGYADVLVGAPAYTSTETSEGRAFLYAGSLTGTLAVPAWTYEPNVTDAQLGAALGTAGDVDGDGLADVIIGAPGVGMAYVFYGTRSGLAVAPDWTSPGDQFDTQYGVAVGAAGDVNGDGFADILVGDPGVDHPLLDEGQVTLYYGAGVRGYPMQMRQVQRDGLAPIAPQGLSAWSGVMQLQTSARAAWGTARARLAWQAAPVGQPFTATGVLSGTGGWSSTLPLGTWLTSTVSGLQPNTAYHWRVRLLYRPNRMALGASRWLHGPAAGQLETMLRTHTLVPLSGLVATQNGPTTVGSTKQFTASVISGTEAVYTWALGDGNAASGASITHTYTATGVYTALVTATNGMSALTSTLAVTITDVPLAGLVVTNTSPVRPGGVVTLSAMLLTGTATSSVWAFGDGAVGTGMLVTHVYTASGFYMATLTVTRGADVLSARTPITVYKQLFLPAVLDHWPYMPGTPTLKLVDAIGATFYRLSWSSVSDASSYQLQESTSSAFTSPTTIYNGTQTTSSVSGKTLGTTYYYRVASITATYQSSWSNVVSTAVTLASNTIVNGGFENGIPPAPWVERSTTGQLISTLAVRSGRYAAYLGGVIDTEDTLYQPVAIASNAISPTLTFWHKISTTDTIFYPYDTLSCLVWDTSGTVLGSCGQLSNVNRSDGWVQSTADLSAYAGKLVRVGFRSYNNSLYPTQFFIDDVSITTKN
jgi:PKD repeat protein